MKAQKGVTLLELMISLVILGILAGMATPSFMQLMVSSSIAADANAMVSDLALARSEAAKLGNYVTVCTSTDGATCTISGWASAGSCSGC